MSEAVPPTPSAWPLASVFLVVGHDGGYPLNRQLHLQRLTKKSLPLCWLYSSVSLSESEPVGQSVSG